MCESDIGKFLDSIPPTPPLDEKKEKKKPCFLKKEFWKTAKIILA